MDKVSFVDVGKSLTEKRLVQVEALAGCPCPPDYRRFLLQFNGGKPSPAKFSIPEYDYDVTVDLFFHVDAAHRSCDLCYCLREFDGDMPERFVPIGRNPGGNILLMDLSEDGKSPIFYWDVSNFHPSSSDEGNTYQIADSFSDLLDRLH